MRDVPSIGEVEARQLSEDAPHVTSGKTYVGGDSDVRVLYKLLALTIRDLAQLDLPLNSLYDRY